MAPSPFATTSRLGPNERRVLAAPRPGPPGADGPDAARAAPPGEGPEWPRHPLRRPAGSGPTNGGSSPPPARSRKGPRDGARDRRLAPVGALEAKVADAAHRERQRD